MSSDGIVERLARHRTVGTAPRRELEWLAAHGTMRRVEEGQFVARRTDVLDGLTVVLSGHFAIYVDRGLGPRKVLEWGAGDVAGLLPYSRMINPPGDMAIDEPGDQLFVHRDLFPEMIRECPVVTAALVHVMLDRARRFTSSDMQDEKMMSLGRVAAGLAHELNNPSSAAVRSARLLRDGIAPLEAASRALGAAGLTAAQAAALSRASELCHDAAPSALSTLARADREEALTDWLEAHGANTSAAASLIDTALTLEQLDSLAATLDANTLPLAIDWLGAGCATRTLAREVEHAAARVHDLVAAVKRFAYMDRVDTPAPVDLATSIGDAVTMLLHKARRKSVAIEMELEPGLPPARAIGGDLGQIWTNLVDNALDAVPDSGRVTIAANSQNAFVIVRVIDNGPGVPDDIRARIFDPFFTTKPVGQGTGLGLDIARRLARRNGGDMEVESRPGHTEFRVTLPAESRG